MYFDVISLFALIKNKKTDLLKIKKTRLEKWGIYDKFSARELRSGPFLCIFRFFRFCFTFSFIDINCYKFASFHLAFQGYQVSNKSLLKVLWRWVGKPCTIPHPRKFNHCMDWNGGVYGWWLYGCWCIWIRGIVDKIYVEPSKGAALFSKPILPSCQQCHKAIYTNIHVHNHSNPYGDWISRGGV